METIFKIASCEINTYYLIKCLNTQYCG